MDVILLSSIAEAGCLYHTRHGRRLWDDFVDERRRRLAAPTARCAREGGGVDGGRVGVTGLHGFETTTSEDRERATTHILLLFYSFAGCSGGGTTMPTSTGAGLRLLTEAISAKFAPPSLDMSCVVFDAKMQLYRLPALLLTALCLIFHVECVAVGA